MELKIEGERVILRKLKRSDAKSIYENLQDKEISKYTTIRYPYKLQDAKWFINFTQNNWRKKKAYEYGVTLRGEDKVIGIISLMKVDYKNKNSEIGYWLGKKYWGKGLMTECLKLLLEVGFKKLKMKRLYAGVSHPNKGSSKVLTQCGMKFEGRLRKNAFENGMWTDGLMYSILKEEYKTSKK
jgi:RimJ/RimL family protein N-acetyltransferase